MNFFLTNGVEFLGPYDPSEIRASQRGVRTLQYDGYRDVYRVEADNLIQAKRKWREQKKSSS